MRSIMQIYKTDWVNIWRAPVALILIIGLMFLPSLYAWLNLIAMWDPYSNTSALTIAVTNEDKGTVIHSKEIQQNLQVGSEVVRHLKQNQQLNWVFVDKQKADHGVYVGEYYASITIPKDFSAKIATLLEENQKHPQIIYRVNEKINAIAPKITEKGASNVTETVNRNVIKTVSEAILSEFNKIGINLENELPTIRNVENRILQLEKHLPEVEEAGKKAIEIEKKLPAIHQNGQKVIELEKKIPEINKVGSFILQLDTQLAKVEEIKKELLPLKNKLPIIDSSLNNIQTIKEQFSTIETTLHQSLKNAAASENKIKNAMNASTKLAEMETNYTDAGNQLQKIIQQNNAAIVSILPIIKLNINALQQTATQVKGMTETLKDGRNNKQDTSAALSLLTNQLPTQINMINQMLQLFYEINHVSQTAEMDAIISRLSLLKTNYSAQLKDIKDIQSSINKGVSSDENNVASLEKLAVEASTTIETLLQHYDNEVEGKMHAALRKLQQEAENEQQSMQTGEQALPDYFDLLQNAAKEVQLAQQSLDQYEQDFLEISDRFHQNVGNVEGNLQSFKNSIKEMISFLKTELPTVEKEVGNAASFVQNDLPNAEEEIQRISNFVQYKLPELEGNVHKVANLVRSDLPQLEDAVKVAADKIRKYHLTHDTEEIISLLKNDIQKESQFIAEPVLLKEKKIFPIPNYGSGMSPFYTTLCLWVGALLLVSLLRFDVEAGKETYKSYQIYIGRLLTFLTIGCFQAIIVTIGDLFILHAFVKRPFCFILFAVCISIAFMTIVYTLVSVFGNIGKAAAIIFLVLQLSGSGGTFPIQVTPPFFQAIFPFLPFTYGISLLREAVGGIVPSVAVKDISCLFIFLAAALFFGLFLKGPLRRTTESFAQKAKASKIIH
ncbi:MAG: YhgE/Pip domain-containing protein [Bacillus sp. (in: firmicutes)]